MDFADPADHASICRAKGARNYPAAIKVDALGVQPEERPERGPFIELFPMFALGF